MAGRRRCRLMPPMSVVIMQWVLGGTIFADGRLRHATPLAPEILLAFFSKPERKPMPVAATIEPVELANMLGLTARAVNQRRAEGRVPTAGSGKIDLAAIVRQWWRLTSGKPGRAYGGGAADLTAEERFDAGVRTAASVTAHLIVQGMEAAGQGADLGVVAAAMLAEALDLAGVDAGEAPLPKRIVAAR